jgi:hypothetical protein
MGDRCRSVEEILLEKLKQDKITARVANLIISAMHGGELDKAPKEQPAASLDGDEPPLAYSDAHGTRSRDWQPVAAGMRAADQARARAQP